MQTSTIKEQEIYMRLVKYPFFIVNFYDIDSDVRYFPKGIFPSGNFPSQS